MTPRWNVWFWAALAVAQLMFLAAHVAKSEWDAAFNSFVLAALNGYIAVLLADKRDAEQFRERVLSVKGWSR